MILLVPLESLKLITVFLLYLPSRFLHYIVFYCLNDPFSTSAFCLTCLCRHYLLPYMEVLGLRRQVCKKIEKTANAAS